MLENDGEELTSLFSRQSGKSETVATIAGGIAIILPILANMPMFLTDTRLGMFKKGIMVGIFAPTQRQAQISFGRMKKRMSSPQAQEVMGDPEVNVTFDVSNGQNIVLSNGSLICSQSASEGSNIEGDSYMLLIVDESQDVGNFKYRKSISPMGAFYNATKILIGTSNTQRGFFLEAIEQNEASRKDGGKRNHFEYDCDTVVKYNPRYAKYLEGEKRRLGENSDEYQMSYKLKWILDRGMFVTSEVLDTLADETYEVSIMDTQKQHVIGIDFGKKSDSTVVTVGEVDWDNPVLVESSSDSEIPDYVAYTVWIKGWLEIQGDDWEEQYSAIQDYISNFNVVRIVMDSTGVGDVLYDRFRANTKCDVIPYVFSKQSKSALYKHLNMEIRAKRLNYPAGEETKETLEYSKFIQQFTDLEKGYSGQLMVVSHPAIRGARDDFPDSCALMMWGARGEGVYRPETTTNPLYQIQTGSGYNQGRNQLTARRK